MNYNWSQLTRDSLYKLMYKAGKDIIGKTLTPKEFKARIKAGLCDLPVTIRVIKHVISETKLVYIGGCYYALWDQENKPPIEVHFHYYPEDSYIALSAAKWKRVSTLFADTVLHELIHMRQYRSRNFTESLDYDSDCPDKVQRQQQAYYGNQDELEAFGFNIACELVSRFNNDKSKILECIKNNQIHCAKHSTMMNYLIAFDFDYDHPVIKKLKRIITKSIDNAQLGKPFKGSKHLTR